MPIDEEFGALCATVLRLQSRIDALEAQVHQMAPAEPDKSMAPVARPIRRIFEDVAREYAVPVAKLLSKDTHAEFVIPRHEAMRRAVDAGYSTPRIGRACGRDHSTVLHGVQRARERMAAE